MSNKQTTEQVLNYATRLGDDALVLGHRISEWVSNAPFLEEDIAIGNVALDYIGRARMFYSYAAELANSLTDDDSNSKTEDDFAFLRNEREYQNYLINELPKGDFAFTIVRQLIIDIYNQYYLEALKSSTDKTLAAIAEKSAKETQYHCRRSKEWTLRLGDGTEESQQRMQRALDDIWGFTHELFEQDALEQDLVAKGIAVDSQRFKSAWLEDISDILTQAKLSVPNQDWVVRGGREGYHTENLGHLLTEMQFVYRSFPNAAW